MKEEIYTAYANRNDITFIMKDTFDESGELRQTECIGWYYGEPDDLANKTFSDSLVAFY